MLRHTSYHPGLSLPFAFDKSMRSFDRDGHLFVEMTNISKANVCMYYGREIPGWEKLGLDANKEYRLYRDPEELRKAAHTFAGKPLLIHHKPTTATDHAEELVCGAVGTNVVFDGVYLRAPLSIWTQDAIDAVESERQRELSPGYRYAVDMTPGHTPDGVAFDGRMTQIMGNHVALVFEGRTGPDVMVADEKPPEFSKMKFAKFLAALGVVTPLKPEQAVALDAALAEDLKTVEVKHCVADGDLSDEEMAGALDAYSKECGRAMDSFTEADKAEAYKRAKAAKSKPAMDEAAVKLAVDAAVAKATADLLTKDAADKLAQDAVTAARAEVHALYAARKAVEPTVGEVTMDTAEAVYRFALDHLKVDHKNIPAIALPALYEASAKAAPAAVALDTAPAGAFDPSILGLSHIRKG